MQYNEVRNALLSTGLINQYQLEYAEEWVRRSHGTFLNAVLELRLINEVSLLKYLATLEKTKYVSTEKLSKLKISQRVMSYISSDRAQKLNAMPIYIEPESGAVVFVMSYPFGKERIEEIRNIMHGMSVNIYVALPSAIEALIKKGFFNDASAFDNIQENIYEDIDKIVRMLFQEEEDVGALSQEVASKENVAQSTETELSPLIAELPDIRLKEDTKDIVVDKSSVQVRGIWALSDEKLLELINTFANILDTMRGGQKGHSSIVAKKSISLAEKLGASKEEIFHIELATYLHETGKRNDIHITLLAMHSDEKYMEAAKSSYNLPANLFSKVNLPAETVKILNHIYEFYDGSGIPDGLSQEQIPRGSRIIAIVDAFEDLIHNPDNYANKTFDINTAINILRMNSEILFDPKYVNMFAQILTNEEMKKKLLAASPWVMVADPDIENASMLDFKLTQQGFNVVVVRDTEKAKEALKNNNFDLIITEVDITPNDGFDFIYSLKKDSRYSNIPVIILSKVSDPASVERGLNLGVIDYITKPYSQDVFVLKVKKTIENYNQQRSYDEKKQRGVSGSLSEISIPDILQILSNARRTGLLTITSSRGTGVIYLDSGRIVDAIYGGLRGEEAFYQIVGWEDGTFSLDPDVLMLGATINRSTDGLIMEGLRRLDESKKQ
jgi:response regulator RpfG family c-di-GMP phosphodiesterase